MRIFLPDKNITLEMPDDMDKRLIETTIAKQFYGIEPDKSWSTDTTIESRDFTGPMYKNDLVNYDLGDKNIPQSGVVSKPIPARQEQSMIEPGEKPITPAGQQSLELLNRARGIGQKKEANVEQPYLHPIQNEGRKGYYTQKISQAKWSEIDRLSRNIHLGAEQVLDSSMQAIRGTIRAIDVMLDREESKTAKDIQAFTEESGSQFALPPKREGFGGYVDDVVNVGPQIATTIASAVIGGVPLAMTVIGAQIAGSTMETLESKGVDPVRSFQAGMLNAAGQAGLEALPVMKALKLWKPGKGAKRFLIELGTVVGLEGLTEFSQSFIESAAQIWGEGKGKDFHKMLDEYLTALPETAKQGVYEAAVAMPWAGLTTGGVQLKNAIDKSAQKPIIKPPVSEGAKAVVALVDQDGSLTVQREQAITVLNDTPTQDIVESIVSAPESDIPGMALPILQQRGVTVDQLNNMLEQMKTLPKTPAEMESATTQEIVKAIAVYPKSDIPEMAIPILQARGVTAQQINEMVQRQMALPEPTPPVEDQAPSQRDINQQTPGVSADGVRQPYQMSQADVRAEITKTRVLLENDLINDVETEINKLGRDRLEKNRIIKPGQSAKEWLEEWASSKTQWHKDGRKTGGTALQMLSQKNFYTPTGEPLRKAALNYIKRRNKGFFETKEAEYKYYDDLRNVEKNHKKWVEQAIAEGKIKSHPDYPDLKAAPKQPDSTPSVPALKEGHWKSIHTLTRDEWIEQIYQQNVAKYGESHADIIRDANVKIKRSWQDIKSTDPEAIGSFDTHYLHVYTAAKDGKKIPFSVISEYTREPWATDYIFEHYPEKYKTGSAEIITAEQPAQAKKSILKVAAEIRKKMGVSISESLALAKRYPNGIPDAQPDSTPSEIKVTADTVKVDIPESKAEALTPKEQKKYLIEEIEAAIAAAPEDAGIYYNDKKDSWHDFIRKAQKKGFTITIDVPGDGEFTIINSKSTLEEFKTRAKSFPAAEMKNKKAGPSIPTIKPTNKRITEFPGEYKVPYKPKKAQALIEAPKNKPWAGFYEDGFFSNGAFLVKMPKPITKRPIQKPSSPVSNFTNVDTLSLQEATIGNEIYSDPVGEKGTGKLEVWVSNMSQEFAYDPEIMDFIFSKHPKSDLMMNKNGALYYFDDKKSVVGMQLPFADSQKPAGTNVTPSGMASMGEFANIPAAMELPEVVKLGKLLMEGKVPRVVEKIGRNLGIRGIFTPSGAGNIKVVADLFQDSMQAAKTIAHEIGHLVDYLDERTMARGNILGRIASLKGYLKKELESIKKREITDEDRTRLMNEAKKLLKESEVWIDEVITKEMKLEPQDILNIWNSVEGSVNPELLDYIKGLSTAEKKAVVKEALKGRIPSELKRFAGQVQVKTGKKIKQSEGSLHDIYAGLINRELEKRRVYKWEEVTTELKDFTMKWKPFDVNADRKYTQYRHRSTELYADALSALITNPTYLQKEAPIFYEAFFEFLSSKPAVQDTYAEILATSHKSSIGKARQHLDDILDMFAEGTEKRNKAIAENQKQPVTALEQAMTSLWDQSEGVLRLVRAFEKHFNQTGLDAANARFAVQELQHIASVTGVYLSDIQKAIIKPLEEAGYSLSDLGVMGFYKRISEGDRAMKANPLGIDKTVAERDLSIIGRHIWGEEKFTEIENLLQQFRKIRESELYPELRKSALFTDKLQSHIELNQHHLKWDVSAYFENVLNSGASGVGHIYKQMGTLAGIDNPIIATILQDLSLMRSALINQAKQEIIPILRHAGEIQKAPTKYSQDKKTMVPVPAPTGYDVMTVFEKSEPGVPHYYLVKENVSALFKNQDVDSYQLYNLWSKASRVVKELIVGKNLAWMATNLNRDIWGAIKNIPGLRLRDIPSFIRAAIEVFPEVSAEAYRKESSDRIRDMKKRRGLATFRQWSTMDDTFDNEILRQLKSYKLINSADAESKIAVAAVKKIWEFLEDTGQMSEMWAKVATQKYLEDPGAMQRVLDTEIGRGDPGRVQARITRELAGTPDSKQRSAKHRILNSLFLFSEMRKAGIRQMVTAFKADKTGYAFKTFTINVLPKMMKYMILANGGTIGLALIANSIMGDDEREWAEKWIEETADAWDRISDSDKMHYDCVPIDILANGKAVYLRFPKDYEGQIFGSIGHLAAKEIMYRLDNGGDIIEMSKGVRGVMEEQVPYGWHPFIKAHWNLLKWGQGESPKEWHGANRIPRSIQDQGIAGADYIKESWPYIWRGYLKDMGLSNWVNLHYGAKRDQEWYEKLLTQPGFSAIGRYLKFSDRGIEEKIYRQWDKIKASNAKEQLEATKASIRLAEGDYKTAGEVERDMFTPGVTPEKIQKHMYNKIPDAYLRMLMKAQTKEQRIAVLYEIAKKGNKE